jgi:hypothetical protein
MDAVTRAVASGKDLYASLGVSPEASDDDIRHAYRALARRHHPDANPDEARGEGFRRVVAAYEILGNPGGRAAYDRAIGLARLPADRVTRPGPVASHVAPRPSGAVASRGPRASANPADHGVRVVPESTSRPREPVDEWRLVSVFGRLVAAAAVFVVIAVGVLMVVAAGASEPESPPATIWCKTPGGWYDCWQATSPDGP